MCAVTDAYKGPIGPVRLHAEGIAGMADVIATLKKLPRYCMARHPSDGSTILIERGVGGYYPAPGRDPDRYNEQVGATSAHVKAMLIGSVFGWEVPGADPDNHA